ncbi:MAG: 30S ribosomal protein S8 [Chloroflexi bacterium]|nr:30S ribosomal protein S8 [Chloroflexota bacterium]
MMTDPIADMLTRIRNALAVRHEWVSAPSSKVKVAIAKLLKDEGFIEGYEVVRDGAKSLLRIRIRYLEGKQSAINGLRRMSKPGLRVYVGKREVPRMYGGRGISVVSTSRGIMTGQEAWRLGLGGELLCYVW